MFFAAHSKINCGYLSVIPYVDYSQPILNSMLTSFFGSTSVTLVGVCFRIAKENFYVTFSKILLKYIAKNCFLKISLMVQWLGHRASTAGGLGSILGRGTRIPQPA